MWLKRIPEESCAGLGVQGGKEGSRCKGEKLDPEVQIHSLEIALPTSKGKLEVISKT